MSSKLFDNMLSWRISSYYRSLMMETRKCGMQSFG